MAWNSLNHPFITRGTHKRSFKAFHVIVFAQLEDYLGVCWKSLGAPLVDETDGFPGFDRTIFIACEEFWFAVQMSLEAESL